VTEIRLYIEGGGDGRNTKSLLRKGFHAFFKELVDLARNREIGWNIVVCGSRNNAFRDFQNALKAHPNAFNILLVDSESPVRKSSWKHLQERDNWDSSADDDSCHLMVQTMEAWFLADIEALKKFYGHSFNENLISQNQNVEEIDKSSLETYLKKISRNTSKGEYQKIQHASKLLELINATKVRIASPHCDRLFTTVIRIIESSIV
jgi:Domain of unknown function (DUF4276)